MRRRRRKRMRRKRRMRSRKRMRSRSRMRIEKMGSERAGPYAHCDPLTGP